MGFIVPQVTILLCGPPRLEWAGQPIRLERRKALALLAYLALAPGAVSRDELAALLWPELSQERARAALRATLPTLTGAAPLAWLVADRYNVSLHPTAVDVDLARFATLLNAVRAHHHGEASLCSACTARLREAAALWRGELLQGFHLPANPDFEAWQLAQRETLRHDLAWILSLLVQQTGMLSATQLVDYAQRWVELDPLNEAAHRALMERYAALGRRDEALRQYQRCAALLQTELGIEPAPETITLYAQLVRSAEGAAPHSTRTPFEQVAAQLPAEPGAFVGREGELAWLLARITEPDCRLVTLSGPGGIGKTRLALRAATMLAAHFAHGACLAALSEARSPAEAVGLIAAALGLDSVGEEQPLALLRSALSQRELLLVLDNLEQIPAIAELVLDLLAAAPALKLLVTSRERLALRAEHVLPLNGLSYPDGQNAPIATFDAVQLFVQRARQLRPDFTLSAANQANVARICALVEGMPLGLELAAAWVQSLSPHEIAAEIAHGADFLRATVRDLPVRHRSLRAIFAHSWRLLSPDEQAGVWRLAIFEGGFSAEAAHSVAEQGLAELSVLVDKSLLRRSVAGRYDFHPLLRQYAAERLADDPAEAAHLSQRHARYFAIFVNRLAPKLQGAEQHAALEALSRDGPNLRAAWTWAVSALDYECIGLMLDGLARFCELRSYRQAGEAALADAAARLANAAPSDQIAARLRARVLAWQGHFYQFLGRYSDSAAALACSLSLAQQYDEPALIAFCLKGQGINANARGEHQQAITLHRASLERYQALSDQAGIADALNRMGGAAYDMGELPMARRWWQESYAVYAQNGDLSGMARALNNLGEVCRILGEYGESRRLSEASLALHAELGPGWSISPYNNLALLARIEGHFAEAARLHERSLAICREVGDLRGAANTNFFLGELKLADERLSEAEQHLRASLSSFRAMGQRQGVSACLSGLAELALKRGQLTEAAALARASLSIAEAIPARLSVGRALSSLGYAQALAGDPAAATSLAAAAAIFSAIGAVAELALVAARREQVVR